MLLLLVFTAISICALPFGSTHALAEVGSTIPPQIVAGSQSDQVPGMLPLALPVQARW